MAREEQRPENSERRKRAILVVLFSLFPLLIGVGILAPGMVRVMAVEEDPLGDSSPRNLRRISRYAHQPLLLPRDFSAGFIPELLDLEHLFSRVDYMADPNARQHARLPSFSRQFGDAIVLDDVDQRIREIVFKDPVLLSQTSPSAYPPPAADLLPLGGLGIGETGPRYDDYFGPDIDLGDIVIPEPSTGLLFGMGLVLLGLRRR
jgi:hypothetical protein